MLSNGLCIRRIFSFSTCCLALVAVMRCLENALWNKKGKKSEGGKPDDRLDSVRCIAFPQCLQWQGNSKLHETLPYGPLASILRATICSAGS